MAGEFPVPVDPVDDVENYLEDEPLLPLEMPTAPEVSLDFGDRANLSNSLRAQMEETAKHFGVLVEFNRVRLKMAAEAGAPRALESAEKAYRAAVVSQSEFLQKILDKLQLLQELKTQEGAAGKAVTFTLNGIPTENGEC